MVSPAVRIIALERSTNSLSTLIFQKTGVLVVSGGTVSLSSTLIFASLSCAWFTLMVFDFRSTPLLCTNSKPTSPLIRASCTRFAVFIRTSCKDNSFTSTLLLNKGSNCTLATILPTLAIVSVCPVTESLGCNTLTPSTPKSRGNTSFTFSTVMFMPIFCEA